jgi:hypothetical protein
MWSFLNGIELLLTASFILGFLTKNLGGLFQSLDTFFKSAEPSLADWSDGETSQAIDPPKASLTKNQQLISLLTEGGYLKDGKVDAAAIDRAIQIPPTGNPTVP